MFKINTIVGLRISRSQLYENVTISGCDHDHKYKFCPECGKQSSIDTTILKSFVAEDFSVLNGYKLYPLTDSAFIISLFSNEESVNDEISCLPILDKNKDMKDFKEQMEFLVLWDEKEFGVWVYIKNRIDLNSNREVRPWSRNLL